MRQQASHRAAMKQVSFIFLLALSGRGLFRLVKDLVPDSFNGAETAQEVKNDKGSFWKKGNSAALGVHAD